MPSSRVTSEESELKKVFELRPYQLVKINIIKVVTDICSNKLDSTNYHSFKTNISPLLIGLNAPDNSLYLLTSY